MIAEEALANRPPGAQNTPVPPATDRLKRITEDAELGRWANALASFREASRDPAVPLEELLPYISSLYSAGREGDLEIVLGALEPRSSDEATARLLREMRAVLLFERGEEAQAMDLYASFATAAKDDLRMLGNLAALLIARQRPVEALRMILQIKRADRRDFRGEYLAYTQWTASKPEAAEVQPPQVNRVQLGQLLHPPLPGFRASTEGRVLSFSEGLWDCEEIPSPGDGAFPVHPGARILAVLWADPGLHVCVGKVRDMDREGSAARFTLAVSPGHWVQRRKAIRLRPGDLLGADLVRSGIRVGSLEVLNISALGIAFAHPAPAKAGEAWEVCLDFNAGSVTVAVAVRRCLGLQEGKCLVAGEFLGDGATLDKIARQVRRLERETRR